MCSLQDPLDERPIYARIEPVIDALLPQELAGFRHGRSTVDHVALLTQSIDDSFSATKKSRAVFVDLTAAYDTVWHSGLTQMLLRLLPDRHMFHMIMELVGNRSFILATGNNKRSRLRPMACKGLVMPGANTWLHAPISNFSIEECKKYRHSITTSSDRCYMQKDYTTNLHLKWELWRE